MVLYHYSIDPEWGWMNARLQTWFPFHLQVCLNGREWLAQQMEIGPSTFLACRFAPKMHLDFV
jgi:hypothetical protein